jgi:DNA-binding response OmpR family regulator
LEAAGAEVVRAVATAREALEVIEATPIDAALLDANLHGHPVDEIAVALARRNVSFLFVTGYGAGSLPKAFVDSNILSKPFGHEKLIAAVASLVAGHGLRS